MKVISFIFNNWEGILSIISIGISIFLYHKQSKLSKKIRLSEIEQKLSEAKYNRERAISNSKNHQGIPFNVQEVGHYFEKNNEYQSDIAYYDNIINDLEARKRGMR